MVLLSPHPRSGVKLPAQVYVEINDVGEAPCASCGSWEGKLRAFVLAADDRGWEPVCGTCWRYIALLAVEFPSDR